MREYRTHQYSALFTSASPAQVSHGNGGVETLSIHNITITINMTPSPESVCEVSVVSRANLLLQMRARLPVGPCAYRRRLRLGRLPDAIHQM